MKKILLMALAMFFAISFSVTFSSCKEDEVEPSEIEKARENKEKCEKFMKDKAAESDVLSDPSGLLFSKKTVGVGIKPSVTDTVAITYVGKTIKGETFVSSSDTAALVDLYDGFYIGLRHMNVGSEYTLYIPYYLMFGSSKVERKFGDKTIVLWPYSALVYEMKLDDVFHEVAEE